MYKPQHILFPGTMLIQVTSSEGETNAILQEGLVNRIGHGIYLVCGNEHKLDQMEEVLKQRIPIGMNTVARFYTF